MTNRAHRRTHAQQAQLVDGHYVYTLSSYDPVEVTLTIPHLSDDEVGIAMGSLIAQHGWNSA